MHCLSQPMTAQQHNTRLHNTDGEFVGEGCVGLTGVDRRRQHAANSGLLSTCWGTSCLPACPLALLWNTVINQTTQLPRADHETMSAVNEDLILFSLNSSTSSPAAELSTGEIRTSFLPQSHSHCNDNVFPFIHGLWKGCTGVTAATVSCVITCTI